MANRFAGKSRSRDNLDANGRGSIQAGDVEYSPGWWENGARKRRSFAGALFEEKHAPSRLRERCLASSYLPSRRSNLDGLWAEIKRCIGDSHEPCRGGEY
jgi:hypothetical protein